MASSEERISAIKYVINGNMMDFTAFMKDWGTPIAAIAGACSWIPFFYSRFKKTKITIIPSSQCSVGLLVNIGPVFRISLGFAAQYNDAVITNVKLILTHANDSQTKRFSWSIINKKFPTTTIPGTTIETRNERNNEVLAIKINQHFLEENFIVFYEDSYLKEIEKKNISAEKELSRLRSINKKSLFLESQQFRDLRVTTEQSFFWKEGEYKVNITIETSTNEKLEVINDKYIFILTQEDIECLERNKSLIQAYYENILKERNEEKSQIEYIWRYTKIKKI